MIKRQKPPVIAVWILSCIIKSQQSYSVFGDYEEDYNYILAKYGKRYAKWWYWKEVFNSLFPFIINKLYWGTDMFSNYLKIAFRNIKKHKAFSIINIMGLSTGLMCTILIMLWVNEQLSYDTYHKNADNIYVVNRDFFNGDGALSLHLRYVAPTIAPKIRAEMPEVEKVARLRGYGGLFSNGTEYFEERNVVFAEPEITDILTFEIIKGDIKKALSDPYNIVLTEKMSEKYFGSLNSIGKSIIIENNGIPQNFKVAGIFKSLPFQSHINLDFLVSFSTFASINGNDRLENWSRNNFSTYILTNPKADKVLLQNKLDKIITDKYSQGGLARTRLSLQSLKDVHLDGDRSRIYIVSSLALFILMIACLNFMNLSTARSVTRAKEVGIRKSIGAHRKELIKQFLGEAIIMTMISLLISIILMILLVPSFNELFSSNIDSSSLLSIKFLTLFIIVGLIIGVITGFYPAMYLSAFNITSVMKKIKTKAPRKISMRTILVIFQFSLAIFLIISAGVLNNQMEYISEKKLGYNKDNILLLNSSKYINEHIDIVKTELLRNKKIKSVTIAKRVPSGYLSDNSEMQVYNGDKVLDVDFRIASLNIDEDYLETFEIDLIAGRVFSKNIKSDYEEAYIINKCAVQKLGWHSPNNALGKRVNYGGKRGKIIGITDDFHFESLHEPIKPVIIKFSERNGSNVAIKIESGNFMETLDFIKEKWAIYNPKFPFDYNYLEDIIKRRYLQEDILKQIFMLAVVLAIIIASLGLLGLSSFAIEQRVKEIGIRKVLGAQSSQIIFILSKEFGKWILIANIFAWPIAYIFMDGMLDQYAFRIDISIWTFIVAGLITFIVAMSTVISQAGKAVLTNPVKCLRVE